MAKDLGSNSEKDSGKRSEIGSAIMMQKVKYSVKLTVTEMEKH
jgi:hypothetical protein